VRLRKMGTERASKLGRHVGMCVAAVVGPVREPEAEMVGRCLGRPALLRGAASDLRAMYK